MTALIYGLPLLQYKIAMRFRALVFIAAALAAAPAMAERGRFMDVPGSNLQTPRVPSTADRHIFGMARGSNFQRRTPARRPLPAWALPPVAAGENLPPITIYVPPPEVVAVPLPEPREPQPQPEVWVIEPSRESVEPDRFAVPAGRAAAARPIMPRR